MAGLAAALELSESHAVTVLEARGRFGGRVHTITGAEGIPYEVGAEFIHGKAREIWEPIERAGIETREVLDRHWRAAEGKITELPDFWERLSEITEQIQRNERDQSFARFISQVRPPAEEAKLAVDFVEGFHAAPAEKTSAQSIRCSEDSSEEIEGQKQFRLRGGFNELVGWFTRACAEAGVELRTEAEVGGIDWTKRPATIRLRSGEPKTLTADGVILTLPLGVLASGAIELNPLTEVKRDAIHAQKMAQVTKVILQFRERFWWKPDFGFIHSDDEWFPTWWTNDHGHILTGWAGGHLGEKLGRQSPEFVMARALESLSKIFQVSEARIRGLLLEGLSHNWSADPFARGAYSYVPAGAMDAPAELAKPASEAVFFAGEASNLNCQSGTVHGAIASGIRAAREVIECFG